MTRRGLIERALLVLGALPSAPGGCARRGAPGSPPVPATAGTGSPAAQLSAAEIEDLVAFGEVVVEGRRLPPAERRHLLEHLETRTAGRPDDVARYRAAATSLARLAGRRFAALDLEERMEVVARHGLAGPSGRPEEDPGPEELRALRRQIVPDLVRGYYGSPAGWAVVGYASFPGRCGELIRYTRPEP